MARLGIREEEGGNSPTPRELEPSPLLAAGSRHLGPGGRRGQPDVARPLRPAARVSFRSPRSLSATEVDRRRRRGAEASAIRPCLRSDGTSIDHLAPPPHTSGGGIFIASRVEYPDRRGTRR